MATKKPNPFAKYNADKGTSAKEGGKPDKAADKKNAKLPAFMKKK